MGARYLFVQPPGRDAREAEANETDYKKVVADATAALKPYLIGPETKDGPTTFIGDSWGAIAAYAVAHELREQCGCTPTHVVVSGNASPEVTSTHNGLGTYSSTPMADLTDGDLIDFLRESGVSEDYKRPADLPLLPSKLMILLGKDDHVTKMSDALGWVDEFDTEVSKVVRVAGATHHVHEEQPEAVADHLLDLMGIAQPKPLVLKVERLKEVSMTLAPPEAFVRGVGVEALQSFREGNLLYRMGSASGSKGELSSLASMTRTRSNEWPSRMESPY